LVSDDMSIELGYSWLIAKAMLVAGYQRKFRYKKRKIKINQ